MPTDYGKPAAAPSKNGGWWQPKPAAKPPVKGQPNTTFAGKKSGVGTFLGQAAHNLVGDLEHPTRILDPGLSLIGTSRKQVAFAAQHPLARAENKGPFAQKGPVAGTVPFFGGPKGDLKFKPTGETTGFIPKVAKGETTARTGGDAGLQVREGLKGAKAVRTQQEKLYTAERGKRAGAAEQAMVGLRGHEAFHAALGQLKGELPKIEFNGLKDLNESTVTELLNHILDHPTLRPYEKINTRKALLDTISGKVPTPSGRRLLERTFGKETTLQLSSATTTLQKAKHYGLELINVPRALMASFDVSAPFRQALVAGTSHPVLFAKNFAPMFKALGSEKAYQGIMDSIVSRPTYPLMQDAGLALTDLEALSTREEQFMSNLAEHIPIVGHGVRGSGRAYVGFLNKMRADVFDQLLKGAEANGRDIRDPKLLKDLAKVVNAATGRGSLGIFQKHAVTLNTLLFSPRLLASRLNYLNPTFYATLDPLARKEALRGAVSLIGTVSTVLTLAKLAGADVNTDPRNADFGKIKVGDTRIDILGGFQQPVRLLAQVISGRVVSSTTGKELRLGPKGPGKLSRKDIIQRFAEQKLAPVPSFLNDVAGGANSIGQPLNWGFNANNPLFVRMIPLLAQDAHDLYNNTGSIPKAIGGYALGSVGFGLQTYTNKGASQKKGSSSWWTSPSPSSPSGGSSGGWWGK